MITFCCMICSFQQPAEKSPWRASNYHDWICNCRLPHIAELPLVLTPLTCCVASMSRDSCLELQASSLDVIRRFHPEPGAVSLFLLLIEVIDGSKKRGVWPKEPHMELFCVPFGRGTLVNVWMGGV